MAHAFCRAEADLGGVHAAYRADLGGNHAAFDQRPEKVWEYVVQGKPADLGVAVEASRLRDPLAIVDHDELTFNVSGKDVWSKFITVRIPFSSALAGYHDLVITNAHLHNVVAKHQQACERFFDRLLYLYVYIHVNHIHRLLYMYLTCALHINHTHMFHHVFLNNLLVMHSIIMYW